MKHQFSQVPKAEIQRSSFDRSHGVKTTFDAGRLVPFYVDEALPGDSFNLNLTAFARMATPIFPIMDNLYMDTFFFAVPYRLVWDNWAWFNGEEPQPGQQFTGVVPNITTTTATDVGFNSVMDYMGIPVNEIGITFNTLHLRAYNLIFNEWFRDQNITIQRPVPKTDSGDAFGDWELYARAKRHDYFTSCLPFPQKGDPIEINLGGQAPVKGIGFNTPAGDGSANVYGDVRITGENGPRNITGWGTNPGNDPGSANFVMAQDPGNNSFPDIYADLSGASAININDLREAFQIQRMLERDARGGSRYIEIIKSHFGVTSPDARLQRPEYLGGGSTRINVTPIASTVPTTVTQETPQGTLAAVGTASINNHGFTKSFTEHCLLIGIVNVRADLTYQQGLNRMWSRQTRYDFYWPALAHLGEQAVLSKEIYADGTAGDEDVFGYQERYAEYRYKPSMITGLFRSKAVTSLDPWHLSQEFEERPTLSQNFIAEDPPMDRVIAVPDEPHFIFDGHFSLRCARPMPLYGVPGYIDHF